MSAIPSTKSPTAQRPREEVSRRAISGRRSSDAIPAPIQDDALIQATLGGDRNAFAGLILKYKDSLVDLAARMLSSVEEAEDAVQDAFLDAYRHLADFNHASRFSTWMYAIVLNRVRNRLRRGRILRWLSLDFLQDGSPEEPISRPFQDHEPSLEFQIDKKLEMEAIQRVVRELPEHYQVVFILYYFQNKSLDEVAAQLNRPSATCKVYLHRARQMLYKRLKASGAVTSETLPVSNV